MNSVSVLLAAILSCTMATSTFAQAVRVVGTSLTMEPPAGFSPAQRFPGFERPDAQASIMVTELPTPAAEMRKGMTKANLATRGMTLIRSSLHQVGAAEGLLVHVSQSADGIEYLKWMLITGDQRTTVMIVGTFPRSADAELGEAIRASVLSARTATAEAAADLYEGLRFRVEPAGRLKIAGRMSNMLVLTESGKLGPQGPGGAMFAVGNSIAAVKIDDLAAFAEARAKKTAKTTGLEIVSSRPLTVDGLDGHELIAQGTDVDTGRRITLYQVIAPDEGGYFVMQGLIATDRAASLIPEFQAVVGTFRRTGGR